MISLKRLWTHVAVGVLTASAASAASAAGATAAAPTAAIHVDFAARDDAPPLSKSIVGVYQTPFWFKDHPPGGEDARRMVALMVEAGVRDFRYELAWGKPDAFAADAGQLDPFLRQLADAKVEVLLALGYCPTALQPKPAGWQRWKDEPTDLAAWRETCRREAERATRELKLPGVAFEVWNEPDMPGDGPKMFFNGDPAAYGRVYAAAAAGVRAGAGERVPVGGPAIAFDTAYLTASGILDEPIDFVSVHAYANAPEQLAAVRRALGGRKLPIRLTEYASFKDEKLADSSHRHPAASAFFADVKGLLAEPGLEKVYWAQWVDDSLGMLSEDLRRRALFNAYAAYQTLLPTTRRPARVTDADGVDALAASDGGAAAIVAWSAADADRTIAITLTGLTGAGEARLFRIDARHASHGDDPATERLAAVERWDYAGGKTEWTGVLPARGVVLIRADARP